MVEPESGPERESEPEPAPDRSAERGSPRHPMPWGAWIEKYLLPILGLGGVVLFGLLTMEYDQFYRELGMAPGDVGVEYSARLSGAVGLVLLSIAASAVLFLAGMAVLLAVHRFGPSSVRERTSRTSRMRESLRGREGRRTALASCCVAGIALVALFVTHEADGRADRAKSGKWVEPLRFGPVALLGVRAYPAEVRLSVLETGKSLDLEGVDTSNLLYIGHGPGTVVLYDYVHQRPLYLPAGRVTVRTYNCETGRAGERKRCDG
ncbi:hypothetical protein ACFWWT_46270 [Streptomyces sp. NPDC058676]|uniref:hypothetical protein n=1 Tax=unclassified Streptomyces TaxID=2593676 RepID=UPI00365442D1